MTMLPDLTVPPHWPAMRPNEPIEGPQDAIKALAEIRRLIVAYRRESDKDWRVKHAREQHIVNVVAGLIADARAIDALHDAAQKGLAPLKDEIERLKSDLAEKKRPLEPQMEMQNRRITALNSQVADLAMLVRRLSRFAPPGPAGDAINYLKRHDLEGSPLRE